MYYRWVPSVVSEFSAWIGMLSLSCGFSRHLFCRVPSLRMLQSNSEFYSTIFFDVSHCGGELHVSATRRHRKRGSTSTGFLPACACVSHASVRCRSLPEPDRTSRPWTTRRRGSTAAAPAGGLARRRLERRQSRRDLWSPPGLRRSLTPISRDDRHHVGAPVDVGHRGLGNSIAVVQGAQGPLRNGGAHSRHHARVYRNARDLGSRYRTEAGDCATEQALPWRQERNQDHPPALEESTLAGAILPTHIRQSAVHRLLQRRPRLVAVDSRPGGRDDRRHQGIQQTDSGCPARAGTCRGPKRNGYSRRRTLRRHDREGGRLWRLWRRDDRRQRLPRRDQGRRPRRGRRL